METIILSPLGNIKLVEEDNQLTEVVFTDQALTEISENVILQETENQLKKYFKGELKEFKISINPSGTEFQQSVWRELQLIPYGKTISYQGLANRLGDPKTIRATASANGQNPLAIIIPCHRVIGANGDMTGYAGGIHRKKKLLSLEGAEVMSQMNLF